MYKRILIVIDGHSRARTALREGLRLARAHEAEVTLLALQARLPIATTDSIPPIPVAGDEFERAAKADADRALVAAHQAADRAGVMSRGLVGRGEDDAAQVVEVARRRRADLVVVPCEDLNALMRLLTGSLVPALITASPVPLLVCKPVASGDEGPDDIEAAVDPAVASGGAARPARVMVVLESRAGAPDAAIAEGLRVAQAEQAEVVFVPAGQEAAEAEPDPASLRERALAAAERAGVAARVDPLDAAPSAQEIAGHAHALGCHLIVVSSEGRNAVTRLLAGSLAPRLITAAEVPVMICRDRDPGARERQATRRPRRPGPPAA